MLFDFYFNIVQTSLT